MEEEKKKDKNTIKIQRSVQMIEKSGKWWKFGEWYHRYDIK